MGHLEDNDEPEAQERRDSTADRRVFYGMRTEEIAELLSDVQKRHSRYPNTDK